VPGPFTAGLLPAALHSLDAATLARLQEDLGALIVALDADERGARIPLAELRLSGAGRPRPDSGIQTFASGNAPRVCRAVLRGVSEMWSGFG